MRAPAFALALLLVAAAAGCAALDAPLPEPAARPGPVGEEIVAPGFREQMHWVPVATADGRTRLIQMRLCRPPGVGAAAAFAVLNHGSPPSASDRPAMRPAPCDSEAVGWFLLRGYAVALPLRRGYGASGGVWAEGYGSCDAPDFAAAGLETARDIAAALAYARALPGVVRGDAGVLVAGQSAGGWGALALASQNPPGVAGYLNAAGGRGGRIGGMPDVNCRPGRLVEAAGRFGATARGAPTLWLYTANDSYFGPRLAAAMREAFTAAGGTARFEALPAFGRDGHGMFFGREGSIVWGPVLGRWLAERGLPAGEPVPVSAAPGTRPEPG